MKELFLKYSHGNYKSVLWNAGKCPLVNNQNPGTHSEHGHT